MTLYVRNPRKAHSLTGRITKEVVYTAFLAVKRNRGAAGIDKVSIKMFEANLSENLDSILRALKDGSFEPKPLRRRYIEKGAGKFRPLGIPAVRDRIAQETLRRILNPIFEPKFHDASFGFRPGRNCHQAIEQVLEFHHNGDWYVLDADIEGFFDNLPHKVIMTALAADVADGNILRLIEKFLRAGVMENGVFKPTNIGTPQGGVISPLLANVVLNALDGQLHRHGFRFVRYADDFVVVTPNRARAKEAWTLVSQTLAELGLRLSPEKTMITTFGKGYSFLGFEISSRSRRMRDKSVEKFRDKVRELTERKRNLDDQAIVKLNRVIRGTARYFATPWSTTYRQLEWLDGWTRMRIRAMWRKRKRRTDNYRITNARIAKLGLQSLTSFLPSQMNADHSP